MPSSPSRAKATAWAVAHCLALGAMGQAQAQSQEASHEAPLAAGTARTAQGGTAPDGAAQDAGAEALRAQLNQQAHQITLLQQALEEQQRNMATLQRVVSGRELDRTRAMGSEAASALVPVAGMVAESAAPPLASAPEKGQATAAVAHAGVDEWPDIKAKDAPVGRQPEENLRPPEVAPIFDQPGVLTPKGRFILEPALQTAYSSNERVALVGFTVIPAILIGLIDVRQVKTTTATASLTGRYGLTNRLEVEARVPYTYINGDTVSREIFTGSAQDKVFNARGSGLGDVEATVRYQINKGGPDKPFYVGWLRYKSNTGKDLFEVTTDCVTRCVANATGTGLPLELPTGSGFQSIQPGVTWLLPSDPVVFFGSASYLHNIKRSGVSRTVLSGAPEGFPQTSTEFIGEVEAGDVIGMNVGLGLGLNEKASISIGYDQNIVQKTKQNGEEAPGAVRIVLGTLLLGGSYRINDKSTLNVALGVGVTRDTPDVSLTVRLPLSF